MNVIVLIKDRVKGTQLAGLLKKCGADRVILKSTVCGAIIAQKHHAAACVFFEREYADDFNSFFQRFRSLYVSFVPISQKTDYNDAIAALNTHKAVYYLVLPLCMNNVRASMMSLYDARLEELKISEYREKERMKSMAAVSKS